MARPSPLHLVRRDADAAGIDALVATATDGGGGRVGLAGIVDDLDRRGRRTVAPGVAVHRALTWDRADRRDPRWWPQGITTSADGSADERFAGRRLVLVAWYSRGGPGVRVSVLDLDSRRYAHVHVVVAAADGTISPLHAHAGGLVWHGDWLHVAATAQGLHTCRIDDVVRLPTPYDGSRFVLPVRLSYRAGPAAKGGPAALRHSFASLDRSTHPPRLVVGEYGHSDQTRRLFTYAVDPTTHRLHEEDDGRVLPRLEDGDGAVNAQGAVVARGRWYVTVSRSSSRLGSVYAGRPGALVRHRWATPMGPEDLAYWPSTDLLWSVSEHPRRRWVFAMRRRRFG